MKNKPLNEATLEARISSVLKNTFPTFESLKIKHQESFTIKFGHHNVTFDKKNTSNHSSRAIYDILLTTNDNKSNLILLELKRENKKITSEDIEQGLSYARLIHPMPPITLLSNGKDHFFYNTFTKELIEKETIDFDFIHTRIDNAFSLALQDFQNTIETLLSKNPSILIQIINDISKNRFKHLKGEISDLTKPICDEFLIKRDYVNNINEKRKEKNLIGLIGSALSGKTNILYDYFISYQNHNNAVYYIDCKEGNYSILQQISNHLTKELKFSINKEKVREWFISSLNYAEISYCFLLDNFDENTSQNIKDEVIELIDIIEGSNNTIIFSIDLINYEAIAKVKFRNYLTIFGDKSFIFTISELNIEEFEKLRIDFYSICKCYFEPGSHFAAEYRQPRIIRLIASSYINSKDDIPELAAFKIIAVPDYELLKMFANNKSFNFEVREIYKKLTKAFIDDRQKQTKNWALNLSAHYGGISLSSIKNVFKSDIEELFKSSLVTKHEIQKNLVVVYPKIPELISFFGINHITELISKEFRESKSVEKTYNKFEKLCAPFINSDNVGVGVLQKLLKSNQYELFSKLIEHLQSLKPTVDKINDGTKIAMLIDEKTNVNIEFQGEDFEEGFISNYFPNLVLSQLAGYPMQLENSAKGKEFDFHLSLILNIANNSTSIIRISNFTFKNMPQIEVFEFDNIGAFLSGRNGIIEPIVQSIQKCFYVIPEQIERLYEYAVEEKLYLVIWRIYLAIRNEINSGNDEISNKAELFINKFNDRFPDLFKELASNNEG